MYDDQNIFAKILRGEIPSKLIYENAHALVIHDAFPQAPVHALVLPKGTYVSMSDFTAQASDAEIIALNRAMSSAIEMLGLAEGGYRVIANAGQNGGQEVPHLHLHILGGAPLGPMIST